MTTANMSVGIKTDAAKQSLRELKSWMQQEMRGVSLSLSSAAIVKDVQESLKRQKFAIGLDLAGMEGQVSTALRQAFATKQRVEIDSLHLIEQVKAAINAGAGGVRLGGVAAPVAGVGGVSADIKTVITQMLVPAVDELAKAAALVGGTARKIGVGASGGSATASSGYSYTDPTTGERISYKRKIDPNLALPTITAGNNLKREMDAEAAAAREAQQDANRTYTMRRNWRRAAETEEVAAFREAQQDANRTYAMRRSWARSNDASEAAATREAQADANRTFSMRRSFARAQDSAEAAAAREAQADANRTFAMRRAFRKAEERAQQDQIAEFFSRQRFAATRQYTGPGAAIAAAQATQARFGADATTSFLGPSRAHLLDQTSGLEEYRRKLRAVKPDTEGLTIAHKAMAGVMNDSHAAARGLAGSMGMLWATYGNVAPLVAAAAIGAGLRSVFTIGKDLEYQLAFVQVLTNGTAISMREFGDAVRGSMSAPTEAAEALRGLAQNGLSARESLQALPSILALATAGELGLSEAALGATGVMAAFNLQVGDLGRVSDVFAKAAAISNTSVSAMVESMKQASTVADFYNVSLEETAAGLAMLAQRNITGTAAGTAYRNMWVELATPTKRASEALNSLGLSLYDSNSQLLATDDVLTMLASKLSTLNEQSRLSFLNDVFGERGSKSASAILSQFDEYQRKLKTLKEESKDFTSTITEALSQTTEGKIKGLISEFQLATATAFSEGAPALKNFVDELRGLAGSERFTKDLIALSEVVINLTKFLIEHGDVLAATFAIWKATGWVLAASAGMQAVRAEAAATGIAMTRLGAAARLAWSSMAGPLGMVALLGAEYFLLRDSTDAATESTKAFSNALDIENQRLQRSTKSIEERVRLLDLQVKFQKEGKSVADARDAAERAAAQDQVKSIQQQITDRERLRDTLTAQMGQKPPELLLGPDAKAARDRYYETKQQVDAVNKELASLYNARNAAEVNANAQALQKDREFSSRRLGDIYEFNQKVKTALEANPKLKLQGLTISESSAPTDREAFEQFMKSRNADFNKNAVNLPKRDPQAESQAHKDELARSRQLIAQMNSEQEALKQQIGFRKALDEARYDPAVFGPYAAALLAEQREIDGVSKSIQLQDQWIKKLQAAKGSALLTDADRTNLQTTIEKEQAEMLRARLDLQNRSAVATARAAQARARDAADEKKTLDDLRRASDTRMREDSNKVRAKAIDPADAAEAAARMDIEKNFASAIAEHEKQREASMARLREIMVEMGPLREEEAVSTAVATKALQENIAQQDVKLSVLRAQLQIQSDEVGANARQLAQYAKTAGYGWDKFWSDYVEKAATNAKVVEDIMSASMNTLSQAAAQYVSGQKNGWVSLRTSILQEVNRILTSKAIAELVKLVGSLFSGTGTSTGGGGGGVTNWNGSAGSGLGATYSANGNVMTSNGPLPLQMYSMGGVATRPQVSVFGEGRTPEAYVPLPDGRSIPVTMRGGAGGDTNVAINISIASDGKSRVESDGSGKKAEQLGKMLDSAVMQVIAREKRPGGLLY